MFTAALLAALRQLQTAYSMQRHYEVFQEMVKNTHDKRLKRQKLIRKVTE